MNTKALEDTDYHIIKQAILDPTKSELSPAHQAKLERLVSASRILDRYPTFRNAVKIFMIKYPEISKTHAYNELHVASRIFNDIHTFDFTFWHTWIINNIVKQIQTAESLQDLKAWSSGHGQLLKAIGEKPEVETDPKLVEKHNFYIQVINNNQKITLDLDKMDQLSQSTRQEIANGLFSEIDEDEAIQIMES